MTSMGRWACFQAFRDVVPGHAGEARFAAPGKPRRLLAAAASVAYILR